MSKIMDVSIETWTPEDAAKQLEHNYYRNRRQRRSHNRMIRRAMRNGTFNSQNGQTLVRDVNGTLFDGQHRLEAQVATGVTLTWVIVTVDDGEDAFKTLDNGAKRNVADYFPEEKNASLFGAIAPFGYVLENSDVPLLSALQGKVDTETNVSTEDGVDYGDEHLQAVRKATEYGRAMYQATGLKGNPSVYGKFAMLVSFVNDDDYLEEFVNDFSEDAPNSKTVVSARLKIANAYSRGKAHKPDAKWLLGMILDSYDHFKQSDDSTELNKGTTKIKKYDKMLFERRAELRGEG